MDFFSSDYCCSLARGNAPSLELLRLSHIIPECHSALKSAVKKMAQEFVKKLMFPLIPCSPLGLAGTPAKEEVMRREELNRIAAAPEPTRGAGSSPYLGCVSFVGERRQAKQGLNTFSACIDEFNPNYYHFWDPNNL